MARIMYFIVILALLPKKCGGILQSEKKEKQNMLTVYVFPFSYLLSCLSCQLLRKRTS